MVIKKKEKRVLMAIKKQKRALIAAKARVETKNIYGDRPLHCASAEGNTFIVERLLSAEYLADTDAHNTQGQTAKDLAFDFETENMLEKVSDVKFLRLRFIENIPTPYIPSKKKMRRYSSFDNFIVFSFLLYIYTIGVTSWNRTFVARSEHS